MKLKLNPEYLLMLSLIILSGCATGPSFHKEQISNPNDGKIYIFREAAFRGSAAQPSVFVDGKFLGFLSTGGYFGIDVAAGEHSIEIGNKTKQALMGWGPDPYMHKTIVQAGTYKYLKFMLDASNVSTSIFQVGTTPVVTSTGKADVSLAESNQEQLAIEIKNCSKIKISQSKKEEE